MPRWPIAQLLLVPLLFVLFIGWSLFALCSLGVGFLWRRR